MILASGEALIDMLPRSTTDGEASFAPYAGGAVMNTAIALSRLGSKTSFFSGLSTDLFGDVLTKALDDSHVDHSLAARCDRPTTLAFVKLVDGAATYGFYDENTAGRMLQLHQLPKSLDGIDALFFGGISLPVEPCGNTYEALMLREAATKVTMIDPNIRISFIENEPAYRARLDRMLEVADIVKLSDEDLHWLMGSEPTEVLAAQLLDKGAKLVCITEGSKGATGYTKNFQVSVAATKVDVVDTVGAGDTFNAGVLASLDRADLLSKDKIANLTKDQVVDALTLGTKAAAVTVSRAGANPPWKDEM